MQEMQEMWVQSLGRNSLEEEMATPSSILTWRIPWAEEPGGVSKSQILSNWAYMWNLEKWYR